MGRKLIAGARYVAASFDRFMTRVLQPGSKLELTIKRRISKNSKRSSLDFFFFKKMEKRMFKIVLSICTLFDQSVIIIENREFFTRNNKRDQKLLFFDCEALYFVLQLSFYIAIINLFNIHPIPLSKRIIFD